MSIPIRWRHGCSGAWDRRLTAKGSPFRFRASSQTGNTYLLLSEVNFQYVPTIGYVMAKGGVNLSDVAYTRPRQSVCVMYNTTSCTTY